MRDRQTPGCSRLAGTSDAGCLCHTHTQQPTPAVPTTTPTNLPPPGPTPNSHPHSWSISSPQGPAAAGHHGSHHRRRPPQHPPAAAGPRRAAGAQPAAGAARLPARDAPPHQLGPTGGGPGDCGGAKLCGGESAHSGWLGAGCWGRCWLLGVWRVGGGAALLRGAAAAGWWGAREGPQTGTGCSFSGCGIGCSCLAEWVVLVLVWPGGWVDQQCPGLRNGKAALGWEGAYLCPLPCPALPCPALPCPALPCPALPCPALPCPALPCHAMPCHATSLAAGCCALRALQAVHCCHHAPGPAGPASPAGKQGRTGAQSSLRSLACSWGHQTRSSACSHRTSSACSHHTSPAGPRPLHKCGCPSCLGRWRRVLHPKTAPPGSTTQ